MFRPAYGLAPHSGLEQVTGWLTGMSLRLQRVEDSRARCPISVRHRSGLFVIMVEQESAECPISVHRSRNRTRLEVRETTKVPVLRASQFTFALRRPLLYPLSYRRTIVPI